MSVQVTIKQLLEAGVHFGHQTRRWNPKMARFIYGEKNGIYIVNLEKTLACLQTACAYLTQLSAQGQNILLVGTKKQAQEILRTVAEQLGMPYVNQRWLGGMLTNFETIQKSIRRLEQLETMESEGTYQFITKKEVNSLKKEREKLLKVLSGVRMMKRLPAALFIIDPVKEEIAVREARKLGIPIVAMIDTNCDPDLINHPIPGNDDAIRSVKLMVETVGASIAEGRNQFKRMVQEKEIADAQVAAAEEDAERDRVAAELPPSVEAIAETVEEEEVEKLGEKEGKVRTKKVRAKKE